MIRKGFMNVKVVSEGREEQGGVAMEKFFEYYISGSIINPVTGVVIKLN